MIPVLVNAGNRTSDELHVHEVGDHANGNKPLVTLKRGQQVPLGYLLGKAIVLTCSSGDGDDFAGQPQVTVTDPPKAQ